MSKEQDDFEIFEETNHSLLFLYFTLAELALTFIAFARTATQEKVLILQLNDHKNKYEIHSSKKVYSKTIRKEWFQIDYTITIRFNNFLIY